MYRANYSHRPMRCSAGWRLLRTSVLYSPRLLTNPETNIRMGTNYLADKIREFGDLHLVLASYNAGESRVARWMADRPGIDPDEFIDDIPFPETQNYVKTVMQFYRYYNPMAEMNGAGGFVTVSANGAMVTRKPGRTGRPARIEVVLDPATGVVTNAQQH